jgi:hypothetical protein
LENQSLIIVLVAGHTNTSAASPGGRVSRRQGAEISANAGATAYEAAARVHSNYKVETQFAAARREKGTTITVVPVDRWDWDWTDWSQLAHWVHSVLLEDDWASALEKPKRWLR